MTYQINPVQTAGGTNSGTVSIPAHFQFAVLSFWMEWPVGGQQWYFAPINNGSVVDGVVPRAGIEFTGQSLASSALYLLNVIVGDGAVHPGPEGLIGSINFDASGVENAPWLHFIVSVDSVNHRAQCYVNGKACAIVSANWYDSGMMASPATVVGGYPNYVSIGSSTVSSCWADAVWALPSSFYDLSVPANLASFIDSSGNPVFLGAHGELPFGGTEPIVFLTEQTPGGYEDFYTNSGSGGGSPFYLYSTVAPGNVCPGGAWPVVPIVGTIADLWFGATPSFVDMTVQSNRRSFIGVAGGAQSLGADGSAPFGVTPPVFLTDTGQAASFATNAGRGGSFIVSGGTLAAGASDPPPSSETTTTVQQNSPGDGVLGDHASGNLYAFNPRTLTDNGEQRRWLRRWRALPQASVAAKRFGSLVIQVQTGLGVPDGANPQIILRWSDDGGHTWSNERILDAGQLGATAETIKFNRLGATRRFAAADRIFELSGTDPFLTAIIDAEVDVS